MPRQFLDLSVFNYVFTVAALHNRRTKTKTNINTATQGKMARQIKAIYSLVERMRR
jgi:hypothetical protein